MTALTKIERFQPQVQSHHFDEKQIELIKNSVCKGASDEELQFFIYACQRTGLDPFAKQIYSVPRGGQRTIQTSVDGFRLIADRTGRYAPGKEPTFKYDKNGNLESATAYVMKQTEDGTWHEVSANASFNEYNAGTPLWKKMPKTMTAKCAECLALRKSFPSKMSGLYGEEEMGQADKIYTTHTTDAVRYANATDAIRYANVKPLYIAEDIEVISTQQAIELTQLLNGCSQEVQLNFKSYIKDKFKADIIDDLPESEYKKHRDILTARYKAHQAELVEKEMAMVGEVEDNE